MPAPQGPTPENTNPAPAPPRPRAGVPALLAAPPNALSLLRALRRCWMPAAVVAIVCAAGATTAAWYLLPPSRLQARTLLQVSPGRTFLFRTAEQVPALGDFQRTQVALVKSRMVLNTALKRPGVGTLGIVQEHAEPIEWLEKELLADFSLAPEVLRIALSGDNAEDLKKVVTAIRDAYKSEVLEKERGERNQRLLKLGEMREAHAAQLRTKKNEQRDLEQAAAGAKDSGVRGLIQGFREQQLQWIQQELLRTQAELRRARYELAVQQATEKSIATAAVPDDQLQELLAQEPAVRKAQDYLNACKEYVRDYIKRAAKGEADPFIQNFQRKQLVEAEAALTNVRKQLTPEITERLRAQNRLEVTRTIRQLQAQVTSLTENEKELNKQIDDLRNSIQEFTKNLIKYDAAREDTSQEEELTKRISDEEERLKIELQAAPEPFRLLEDGIVTRASDDKRLILMSAGAGVGTLCAVLLGFAFWEFRARRIDSVDEVVHGLGMNLVGTIPDSSRSPRTNAAGEAVGDHLLTEAVDATRVMLLQASRTESLRVVMVTSAQSGEGKTSLSTHLAASLANVGYRTLLIDGDLRNPIAHRVFDIESAPGFCELLRGEAEVGDVVRPTPVEGLAMIPAGQWDSQASRDLGQEDGAGRILRQFREEYDFVIIDSSPVLPVVDPLLIGQHTDGAILSVLRDVSRMPNVYAAHQRLTAGGVRVLGAVVNGVRGDMYGAAYAYRERAGS
jgi:succinoglycan biosynthesis transport protein ExoP